MQAPDTGALPVPLKALVEQTLTKQLQPPTTQTDVISTTAQQAENCLSQVRVTNLRATKQGLETSIHTRTPTSRRPTPATGPQFKRATPSRCLAPPFPSPEQQQCLNGDAHCVAALALQRVLTARPKRVRARQRAPRGCTDQSQEHGETSAAPQIMYACSKDAGAAFPPLQPKPDGDLSADLSTTTNTPPVRKAVCCHAKQGAAKVRPHNIGGLTTTWLQCMHPTAWQHSGCVVHLGLYVQQTGMYNSMTVSANHALECTI